MLLFSACRLIAVPHGSLAGRSHVTMDNAIYPGVIKPLGWIDHMAGSEMTPDGLLSDPSGSLGKVEQHTIRAAIGAGGRAQRHDPSVGAPRLSSSLFS